MTVESDKTAAPADWRTAVDASEGSPLPRVGRRFFIAYGVAYFGFFLVLFMPALFSVPYEVHLLDEGNKETILGLVVGISAIVLLPVGPIVGVLSDRSRIPWGRRRPFLLIGFGVLALSASVVALAPNVPLLVLGYLIGGIGTALTGAAMNPVLAEHVPPEQRGKLGALSGVAASMAGVSATLVGSFLTGNLLVLFLLPVAVFAVGVVLWIVVVPDAPAPDRFQATTVGSSLRSPLFDPRTYPDFAWIWIGKLSTGVGTAFFTTYQLYFLLDRLGYTAKEAGQQLAVVGGLAIVATIASTILGGLYSDRLQRRKPFIYPAAAFIAAGMGVAALAPNFALYAVGGVLLAAGSGAFNAVDLAMASDLLPDSDAGGKWMGIYQVSGTLAAAVGPVLAPVLLAMGGAPNYTVLFIGGRCLALGAAATAYRVRGVRLTGPVTLPPAGLRLLSPSL